MKLQVSQTESSQLQECDIFSCSLGVTIFSQGTATYPWRAKSLFCVFLHSTDTVERIYSHSTLTLILHRHYILSPVFSYSLDFFNHRLLEVPFCCHYEKCCFLNTQIMLSFTDYFLNLPLLKLKIISPRSKCSWKPLEEVSLVVSAVRSAGAY